MSKRKAKPNPSGAARPVSPPASVAPEPVKPGPAAAPPPQAVPSRRTPWIWLAAGAIVLLGLLALVMVVQPANKDGASLAEVPAAAPASSKPIGGVTGCRKLPNFVKSVGFTGQAALSTSESQEKGLVLIDLADANHRYQHPTWTQLGYLGPITYDSQGNVYVAPTPHVSLIENPPEQQTTIYRADTDTGELAEFLKLEPVTPPTGHPFGVMGLTYDCDTNSLYATTVAGSTRREELGRLVRIDPSTGKVTGELPKTDAIGLAVFNGTTGKRLYFGSARNSEVRSVALDDQGNFSGPVRVEFKIPGWEDKARRISFDETNAMNIVGVPFDFTLVAASENRQTPYQFTYDASTDTWMP